MGNPLPWSLTPIAHLVEQAALARRLAIAIGHDPAAPRLLQMAAELDAEIVRLGALIGAGRGQGVQ
jgi:hypothetical protein